MLDICEIFGPTIQGEGKKIGTPSIFIRFGRCNMQCAGFGVQYTTPNGDTKQSCDSYYASDIAFKNLWTKYKTYKELVKEVDKIIPNYKIDIVITGGEPLLYWEDDEFQNLLKYYITKGYNITIETNGSLDIDFKYDWQKKILFSISVKLSNSQEPLSKRVNKQALTNMLNFTSESYLKFVVDKSFLSQASKEIDDIIKSIPKCEIYIMPLGNTKELIDTNSEAVINFVLQKGYKYSDRIHIRVWNNKKGV